MKDYWSNKATYIADIQGLGDLGDYCRRQLAQRIYNNLEKGCTGKDAKDAVESELCKISREFEEDFSYEFEKATAKIPKPYSEFISVPEINWLELVLTCNMNELLDMVQELINEED